MDTTIQYMQTFFWVYRVGITYQSLSVFVLYCDFIVKQIFIWLD